MQEQNYQSLIKTLECWEDYNPINKEEKNSSKVPLFNIANLIASIFSPGEFYSLIMDFNKPEITSVSTSFYKILGYTKHLDLSMFFKMLHPEDAEVFSQREIAIGQFYQSRIPQDQMLNYKTSYVVRLKHANGTYKKIHIQAIPLKISTNRTFQYVLHIHSDISYLKVPVDNRVSFISLNNNTSYYSLCFEPNNFLLPEQEIVLTYREKQIVKLLATGLASKEIAIKLFISKNTVDTFRRNLLKKTNTKNTLELTALCIRKGLI